VSSVRTAITDRLDRSRPLRFLLAGGLNSAVSYGAYALFLWMGVGLALTSLMSLLAGMSMGFLIQGGFVFRALSTGGLIRYVLAWSALLGVHYGIVVSLMRLGIPPLAGAFLAMGVVAALSYFVQRDLVFRVKHDQTSSR
jgi:putative flippase GtrA